MKILGIFVLMFSIFSLSGCGWVGNTAGKTEAKIEKGYEQMQDGYREGYASEKNQK